MKKWLYYFLFLMVVLQLTSCNQDKTLSETNQGQSILTSIKERGKLKIGVFSDKPPFGYIDEKGQNQGYDIELGKRLAKDLLGDEDKVEFILVDAQNRIDVLRSNKVDIVLANFTKTAEREQQVLFAKPYMKTAIGLVSLKNDPIQSINELESKTILVNKGTTAEIYFTKELPTIKRLSFDHNTETFNALKDKRAPALAHDNTLLYAWVKNNPEYIVSINQIGPEDVIAPAVKKGNIELLNWINQKIDLLYKEDFFFKAYDKTIKPFYGEAIDPKNIVIAP